MLRLVRGSGCRSVDAASYGRPRERWTFAQPRGEDLAFDQLHGDERPAVGNFHCEDRTDVRMVNSVRGASFSLKTSHGHSIEYQFLRKELQSDNATEFQVLGAVNDTHTAATE